METLSAFFVYMVKLVYGKSIILNVSRNSNTLISSPHILEYITVFLPLIGSYSILRLDSKVRITFHLSVASRNKGKSRKREGLETNAKVAQPQGNADKCLFLLYMKHFEHTWLDSVIKSNKLSGKERQHFRGRCYNLLFSESIYEALAVWSLIDYIFRKLVQRLGLTKADVRARFSHLSVKFLYSVSSAAYCRLLNMDYSGHVLFI